MKLVDSLQLIALATSLGGTVSKAVHVPTTTHKSLDDACARGRRHRPRDGPDQRRVSRTPRT